MKERISIQDLEKMNHTKLVCTQKISFSDPLFGDDKEHQLTFDIFDGFAYCPNYKGKEYYMVYPRKALINLSASMQKSIREFMELEEKEEIKVTDILASYYNLYCNE